MRALVKNERGYALVTVLLIFLLLIIGMISFTTISGSTMKHHAKSEEKHQATALAEMGVEYFHHAIENLFFEIKDEVENSTFEEEDTYHVIQQMITLLQDKITEKNLHNLKISPQEKEGETAYYQIQFKPYKEIIPKEDSIIINFSSVGKIKETNSEIRSTMTIDFNNRIHFLGEDNDESSGFQPPKIEPPHDDIEYDEVIDNNRTLKDFDFSDAKVKVVLSQPDFNGKDFNNSKIDVLPAEKDRTNFNNENNINSSIFRNYGNMYLHTKATVHLNENSELYNNTLERNSKYYKDLKGHLHLHNQSKIMMNGKFSRFYNFGNLYAHTHAEILVDNYSQFYNKGDIQFHQHNTLTITNYSKVRVDGNILMKNITMVIDDKSLLCVGGEMDTSNLSDDVVERIIIKNNSPEYDKLCAFKGDNDDPGPYFAKIDKPKFTFDNKYN